MVLGVVWHFWIAVPLALSAFALVFAIIFLYVRKVVMPRYPRG